MAEKKSKKPLPSKLLNAASTLSAAQQNDFLVFMKMPSNSLSGEDQRAMAAFLKRLDTFSHGALEDEFWEKQLKDTNTHKKHMMNRLLKALERYLALDALEQNTPLQYSLLAASYLEKGISKNAAFYIKKARALINAPKNRNLDEWLLNYRLYELEADQARNKRAPGKHLELMKAALKRFYDIHQMRLLCEQVNRQRIIGQAHEIGEMAVFDYDENAAEEFHVYYWQFQMLKDNDRSAYRELRAFIQKNEDFFIARFQKEVIAALMNFCIRHINQGGKQYAEDYLSYIALLEKKGLLLDGGGYLATHRLPNCILACILLGQMGKARAFLQAYGPKLLESKEFKSEPFLNYYRAIIELFDGQADEAWELLRKFQESDMYLKDVYHKIACDKMLLMAFYLQEEFDSILERIDALRKYIRENDRLDESRKEPHLVFLKLLRRLAHRKATDWKMYKDQLLIPDCIWLEQAARSVPLLSPE